MGIVFVGTWTSILTVIPLVVMIVQVNVEEMHILMNVEFAIMIHQMIAYKIALIVQGDVHMLMNVEFAMMTL